MLLCVCFLNAVLVLSLSDEAYETQEGETLSITVQRSGQTSTIGAVIVKTRDITATGNADCLSRKPHPKCKQV